MSDTHGARTPPQDHRFVPRPSLDPDAVPLGELLDELSEALGRYWDAAEGILHGSGVALQGPAPAYFSLDANVFSALFLYSYRQAGIPRPRRVLYGAVNQCLRGMVTGCDNLLDDEYKVTLETDLPPEGTRFRSVLDIMVSDRVLFELLSAAARRGEIDPARVLPASAASLRALVRSGAQEASEEGGVATRLRPEAVLDSVHRYKTGILFRCPWAVPGEIEALDRDLVARLTDALYRIGMGCQILDDMVDLARDVADRRHNYLASLIYHDPDPGAGRRLEEEVASHGAGNADLVLGFDRPRRIAAATARAYLTAGAAALYAERHRDCVEPTVRLLAERIGAARFLGDAGA